MKKILITFVLLITAIIMNAKDFQKDTIKTSNGDLIITFIGHATLMMEYNGMIIHIDPVTREADYDNLPKADLVLITHHHGDHLDFNALNKIQKENTVFVGSPQCQNEMEKLHIDAILNGNSRNINGLTIKAVAAYNVIHKRPNGSPFHPKGEGNGYIITFGDMNVYIAGDTENTPEMKNLEGIDIAFLPMNLPYTMTPEMVADAVKTFKPKVLYPYHYGSTDINRLINLLKDNKDTEVRIRKM